MEKYIFENCFLRLKCIFFKYSDNFAYSQAKVERNSKFKRIWRIQSFILRMFCGWSKIRRKVFAFLLLLSIMACIVYSGGRNELLNLRKEPLLYMEDLSFTINTFPCKECKDNLIVAIIHTAPNHIEHRTAIRNTWGKQAKCQKFIFATGVTNNIKEMRQIQSESDEHHDIIQGNFIDTYNNLTYKHIMALKWVTDYCPNAKYVVKADDDVMVNTSLLVQKLENNDFGNESLIACGVLWSPPVIRGNSKWAVSKKEYPEDHYPNYCLGPFIIYSADVVRNLLRESYKVPYFFIDDVYVTGTLAKRLGYKHLQLMDSWYTRTAGDITSRAPGDVKLTIYGPIEMKPKDIIELWKYMQRV